MLKFEDAVTHLKDVEILCGTSEIQTQSFLPIFSEEACVFLYDLSQTIMRSQEFRMYNDIAALAFWCRKANIQKIKSNFGNTQGRLGRGLCFHISPSNIPINFAFSYFFSLLAGNSNMVRLPSKIFPQVEYLCQVLDSLYQKHEKIRDRSCLIRYPRNDSITEEFSKISDCRMIWGGDKTIQSISSMESKPRCVDLTFADRYSICIIDGKAILNSDSNQIKRLSEGFYVDTFLMDQNACSSPQIIYWLNDSSSAREKFWNAVFDYAKQRYELQDAIVIDKYTQICASAITQSNIKTVKRMENLLYLLNLDGIDTRVEMMRGKGGLFHEYALHSMSELYENISERYQKVSYFSNFFNYSR